MSVNVFDSTSVAVEDIDMKNDIIQENIVKKVKITEIGFERTSKYIGKFIKRIVDVATGIVGALFLIPLTIAIYIINKVNRENGPLFFIQERLGKDGKTFKI